MARLKGFSVLAFAAAMLSIVPSHADARTDTRSYIGGTGNAGVLESATINGSEQHIGLGGVIVNLQGGETTLSIALADDNGTDPVDAFYYFRTAAGAKLGATTFFCGSADAIAVPPEAASVLVGIDTLDAPLDGCGVGTTGTVSLSWA